MHLVIVTGLCNLKLRLSPTETPDSQTVYLSLQTDFWVVVLFIIALILAIYLSVVIVLIQT